MESKPGILCRGCGAKLFSFDEVAILDSEKKVVIRPDIVHPNPRTFLKRPSEDSGNGASPSKILCASCLTKIGVTIADALTETSYDEIQAQHVAVLWDDGARCEPTKWTLVLELLETQGLSCLKGREYLRLAGMNFWSREGATLHPTFLVDVDGTPAEALERLTVTKMRNYQSEVLAFCLRQNSLLCLPTGSGKTLVAAGVVRAMLHLNPQKVAVFVVNTNHLVEQQNHAFETEIPSAKIITIFGQMDPDLRRKNMKAMGKFEYDILICTCACLNKLIDKVLIRIEDICCLVLDEAHETRGVSPYVELIGAARHPDVEPSMAPLILAMTASPLDGIQSSTESVGNRVCELTNRLGCEPCFPRNHDPYEDGVFNTKDVAFVEEPGEAEQRFRRELDQYLSRVVHLAGEHLAEVTDKFRDLSKFFNKENNTLDTNELRGKIRKIEDQLNSVQDGVQNGDYVQNRWMETLVCNGYAVRDHLNQILAVYELNHVIGHRIAKERLKKVFDDIEHPSPGQEERKKKFLYRGDVRGQAIYASLYASLTAVTTSEIYAYSMLSTKCKRVMEMIRDHFRASGKDTRILLFVDMRRTAKKLCAFLHTQPDIRQVLNPRVIVGRGICGDGFNVDEQQATLNDFRRGQTKLLVTTTVLEEGLDVPSCNMVIRMKAPEKLIQFVQSRGRACRMTGGKYYIICKDQAECKKQQKFLDCQHSVEKAIKNMMQRAEHSSRNAADRPKKVLDLEEDNGRKAAQMAHQEQEPEEINEKEIEELIALLKQVDGTMEQANPNPLEEYDADDLLLKVKFAVFDQGENEDVFYSALRENFDNFCPEVQISSWKCDVLKVDNALGTRLYPTAELTLSRPDGTEDVYHFERKVLILLTRPYFNKMEIDFWTKIERSRGYFPKSTTLRLSLHQASLGSLVKQRTFVKRTRLGTASYMRLERAFDRITITVNDIFQIEASFADLREFAIVDLQEDSKATQQSILTLYLTFSHPPRLAELRSAADENGKGTVRAVGYGEDVSQVIFSNCLTYKLDIPNPTDLRANGCISHRIQQVLRLLEATGVSIYFTSMQNEHPNCPLPGAAEGLSPELCPAHCRDPEVNYAMRCVRSSPGFVAERFDAQFYHNLNQLRPREAVKALYSLAKTMNKNLFADPSLELRHWIDVGDSWPSLASDYANHAYIKRVVLTPTSIRFYEPDFVQTNRIIRGDTDEPGDFQKRERRAKTFVKVAIRDENSEQLTSLFGEVDVVVSAIEQTLLNGFDIGQTHYVYLAASNSQIRNHSCYFIADDGDNIADRERERIGDLSEIKNVASFASKLGLAFSTSSETVDVPDYQRENDIQRNGCTFSDGVGLMSRSLAARVSSVLKLEPVPSAFQIRIGGCKGMLSVWKDELLTRWGYGPRPSLVVRDSMWKYPSDNFGLFVLDWTRPLVLHLNQQVIMLLSNLGVADDIFMRLLRNEIDEMGKMFCDNDCAAKNLKAASNTEARLLQRVKFNFTTDPFFRNVMMAIYTRRMKDLKEKSHVRLDAGSGRVLLGVLDETGILNYGEVFIQISEYLETPGSQKRVITDQIVIMKNPCIHPGDVRTFRGRDVPELRHLFDCVVFPQKGPRPHPNELSGSDLDGDTYHCIWDPRLQPVFPVKEAMDYTGSGKEELDRPVEVKDLVKHTCKYLMSDTLGMIANVHKALADQSGLESESCIKLAELHALAVDAPKTGKWVTVPRDIKNELKRYPDFMMKEDKPSYPSSKVLGQMFRECSKYMLDHLAASNPDTGGGHRPSEAFIVDGFRAYLADAETTFKQYNQEILGIMRMYGIKTEAEVWSLSIFTVHPRLKSEMDDVQQCVKILMQDIKKKYKRIFEVDERLQEDPDAGRQKKASAWYFVAYDSRQYGDTYQSENEIFRNRSVSDTQSPESQLSDSIKEIFDHKAKEILDTLRDHERTSDEIGSRLYLFDSPHGEAHLLLCRKKRPGFLSSSAQLSLLGKVASDAKSLFNFTRMNEKARHMRVKVNKRIPVRHATLTADRAEVLKWMVMKKYIFKHRWLFPVLRILCSWLSVAGLIGGKVHFFPEYLVPLMFINHWLKDDGRHPIPFAQCQAAAEAYNQDPVQNDTRFGEEKEWENLFDFLKSSDGSSAVWQDSCPDRVGRLLHSFMKEGGSLGNTIIHPSLREVRPVVHRTCRTETLQVVGSDKWGAVVDKDDLELLAAEMEKASHRLSIHVHASILLSKVTVERQFYLELAASKSLAGEEDGLAWTLHSQSGAWVDIQSCCQSGTSGKIVKGRGTEAELHLLNKTVKSLNARAHAQSQSRSTLRVRGLKDVTGAHNLLVEGAVPGQDEIRLEPYLGYRYPQHDHRRLYVIRLQKANARGQQKPVDLDIYDKFRKHFRHQISYFLRHYSKEVYGDHELQIKFGRTYVVSPPPSYVEDSSHLTAEDLIKALERRKARAVDPMFDLGTVRDRRGPAKTPGAISTSFVSSIALDKQGTDYLKTKAKARDDVPATAGLVIEEEGVKMVAHTGAGTVTARYDTNLNFQGFETSPIRWIVSDVKRICAMDEGSAEGHEVDIRFLLKTQMCESGGNVENAQSADFVGALVRMNDGKLRLQNEQLDVDFIEQYETFKYQTKSSQLGDEAKLVIRRTTQYTRRIGKGRFSNTRAVEEVRLVPLVEPLLSTDTMERTLDALWTEAFEFSDNLKCKTQ